MIFRIKGIREGGNQVFGNGGCPGFRRGLEGKADGTHRVTRKAEVRLWATGRVRRSVS